MALDQCDGVQHLLNLQEPDDVTPKDAWKLATTQPIIENIPHE